MYYGMQCFGYALNCHFVYLAIVSRDMLVIYEKAKFVYFIYMQLQKVKFTSVQINMKQVSYNTMHSNRQTTENYILPVRI